MRVVDQVIPEAVPVTAGAVGFGAWGGIQLVSCAVPANCGRSSESWAQFVRSEAGRSAVEAVLSRWRKSCDERGLNHHTALHMMCEVRKFLSGLEAGSLAIRTSRAAEARAWAFQGLQVKKNGQDVGLKWRESHTLDAGE